MKEPSKSMPYGLIGEDHLSTSERLEKYRGVVDWSYLKAAGLNGVLYYVDPSLMLQEVGAAFIHDEADQLKKWLKSGELVKMEEIHLRHFEAHREQLFEAVVVSPFILCRESKK